MDEPGTDAYMPLTSFRYFPRWFDPNPHCLPEPAWPDVHALVPQAARAAYEVRGRLLARVQGASERMAVAADIEDVRRWLLDRGVPTSDRVAVTWDASTAVLTRWNTFQRHWNAFWYHSHLQMAVFPLDERFVLFDDQDSFVFARLDPGS